MRARPYRYRKTRNPITSRPTRERGADVIRRSAPAGEDICLVMGNDRSLVYGVSSQAVGVMRRLKIQSRVGQRGTRLDIVGRAVVRVNGREAHVTRCSDCNALSVEFKIDRFRVQDHRVGGLYASGSQSGANAEQIYIPHKTPLTPQSVRTGGVNMAAAPPVGQTAAEGAAAPKRPAAGRRLVTNNFST
ncbi:hypothetical protein EVAR_28536_1 [Eumeta japonica]|uniref:Uncharacterized protein n=1 Tax=Eumeta variegata TaxID=151549 RepID=A0A4C1UY08_EUMVA|nr:hypothetical protein EVAR_28536_1 [Eumeta japonica]